MIYSSSLCVKWHPALPLSTFRRKHNVYDNLSLNKFILLLLQPSSVSTVVQRYDIHLWVLCQHNNLQPLQILWFPLSLFPTAGWNCFQIWVIQGMETFVLELTWGLSIIDNVNNVENFGASQCWLIIVKLQNIIPALLTRWRFFSDSGLTHPLGSERRGQCIFGNVWTKFETHNCTGIQILERFILILMREIIWFQFDWANS